MKAFVGVALFLAASAHAHCILQRLSVGGSDKGLLVALRSPSTNNPVTNVQSNDIICNAAGSTSSTIIDVAAGSQVGAYWQHIIGGPQGSNDPDNPIAASHKGPIQVYLAKVDNAASSGTSGLKWFKVASEGETGGHWAVDTMIANSGWWYFTLPSCIAAGNYLMRVEIIALHNAYSSGGAQFYVSCGQINVTGGGSFTPSSTVSFPGVYSASDPGIQINIYDASGNPTNGGKAYTAPGPAVITCSGSSNNPPPSSSSSSSRASSSSSAGGSSGGAALYGQCGGQGWTGPTTCSQGTCKVSNQWYSQCLP